MKDRLQKVLSRAGYGSRRKCERLIAAGRVSLNGQIASLGDRADGGVDEIRVDGQRIGEAVESRYVLLNKPRGVLSSLRSQGGHRIVRELVSLPGHLYPVGRLDLNSEGLLLMTNDGDLANRLTHPRYEHEKEYRVLVDRPPNERQLAMWREGVVLLDGQETLPARVELEGDGSDGAWLRVVMREGKNRQIREVADLLGLGVGRLIRVRMASLTLGDLSPGDWRELGAEELERLRRVSGVGSSV